MSDRTQISTVPGEARRYQGLPAGLVTRVGANVIDLLVLAVALVVIYGGWAAVRLLIRGSEFRFPTPTFATVYVVGSVVFTVYLAASWAATGRTYGAQVMGLRVVDRDGHRIGGFRALARSVLCVSFPIGLLWCAVNREKRSLQDLIVRTSVIYDWAIRGR